MGSHKAAKPISTENGKTTTKTNPCSKSATSRKGLPPQLIASVTEFLTEFGFHNTSCAFTAEQNNVSQKLYASSVNAKSIPSLLDLYKIWERQVGASRVKKTPTSSSSENSQSSSNETSESDIDMKDAQHSQDKRKHDISETSSPTSSISSDSDADDEDEEEAAVKPPEPSGAKRKVRFSSSSSYSGSNSGSGSGSDEKVSKAKRAKFSDGNRTLKMSKSSSESSASDNSTSTSVSGSTSKSESESDRSSSESSSASEREAAKKRDKVLKSAMKTPLPPSNDSDSSDTTSGSSDSDRQEDDHGSIIRTPSTDTGTLVASSSSSFDGSSNNVSRKLKSKTVDNKKLPTKTDPKGSAAKSIEPHTAEATTKKATGAHPTPLAAESILPHDNPSNAYIPYAFAERAHKDLSVTRGKGFTKEKNKKKRGSYRGGLIDIGPAKNSYKFED